MAKYFVYVEIYHQCEPLADKIQCTFPFSAVEIAQYITMHEKKGTKLFETRQIYIEHRKYKKRWNCYSASVCLQNMTVSFQETCFYGLFLLSINNLYVFWSDAHVCVWASFLVLNTHHQTWWSQKSHECLFDPWSFIFHCTPSIL